MEKAFSHSSDLFSEKHWREIPHFICFVHGCSTDLNEDTFAERMSVASV
jgi:hypothetical protein